MPRPATPTATLALSLAATTLATALAAQAYLAPATAAPAAPLASAASDTATCTRTWRLDLGASLDTVGAGRYECPGCDGAITDGERMSAAGQPLQPQRVIVTVAGDESRILWDGMLDVAASPVIIRNSVVFPAPFGPSRPVMPGRTSNETSLTATTLPNQRETPFTRITGASAL